MSTSSSFTLRMSSILVLAFMLALPALLNSSTTVQAAPTPHSFAGGLSNIERFDSIPLKLSSDPPVSANLPPAAHPDNWHPHKWRFLKGRDVHLVARSEHAFFTHNS
ncbi:MAG: hypothetical protein J3R72DRAFT_110093 [Linnemannia gamsii]|nr:MAG: hypothetical protein J3R72DRAFT_110093 [Linnemannia gamsii]